MKRINTILGILLLLAGPAWAQPRKPVSPEQKLRQAEHFIANVMRKFGQALDFNAIYRNMVWHDDFLSNCYLNSSDGADSEVDAQVVKMLDSKTIEKACVSFENFAWLHWLYFLQEEKGKFVRLENTEQFYKREIRPKLNKRQRKLFDYILSDEIIDAPPLKSKADFTGSIIFQDLTADAVKRHFPRQLRYNLKYKVIVNASLDEVDNAGNQFLNKPHYSVSANVRGMWGSFQFTVVEKAGVLKVASVGIADGPQ